MIRKYLATACLIACCGLVWLSGCQSEAKPDVESAELVAPEKPPVPGGPAPKISFAKLMHDFGDVPPNKAHKGEIKFTNTGQATLVIKKVSECCGVDTKLAGKKTRYEPGESGAVLIEWRSGSMPTPFQREFTVHSNDSMNPAVKLKVRAKVTLRVKWQPDRMKLLLDQDDAAEDITIRSVDGRPFSITSFKSTGDCITADFDPSVEATKFVLAPKVDASKLQQNLKGRILIGTTHPDGPAAIILFDVRPKYTTDPLLFLFFYAEPGKPMVRKMAVLNNYGQDFTVKSLTSKTGAVGVRVLNTRKITDGYQLEIEVMPPERGSEDQMKVADELVLTLGSGEQVPIRCNLWYTKKAKSAATVRTK